jgi:hypothetical protein
VRGPGGRTWLAAQAGPCNWRAALSRAAPRQPVRADVGAAGPPGPVAARRAGARTRQRALAFVCPEGRKRLGRRDRSAGMRAACSPCPHSCARVCQRYWVLRYLTAHPRLRHMVPSVSPPCGPTVGAPQIPGQGWRITPCPGICPTLAAGPCIPGFVSAAPPWGGSATKRAEQMTAAAGPGRCAACSWRQGACGLTVWHQQGAARRWASPGSWQTPADECMVARDMGQI